MAALGGADFSPCRPGRKFHPNGSRILGERHCFTPSAAPPKTSVAAPARCWRTPGGARNGAGSSDGSPSAGASKPASAPMIRRSSAFSRSRPWAGRARAAQRLRPTATAAPSRAKCWGIFRTPVSYASTSSRSTAPPSPRASNCGRRAAPFSGRSPTTKLTPPTPQASFSTRALTTRLAEDGAVDLVDSCAQPGHPMIERVWADRLDFVDLAVARAAGPCFAASLAAERTRLKLRERIKSIARLLLGRKRS